MPSVGETGWGELVSNNFETLDTNLNDLQTQINTINTNIGDGTRILSILSPPTIINSENFSSYASYDNNNVYIAQFRSKNVTFESIPRPPHSYRLMIILVSGNLTINGNIDTYPTTLQSETPPNSETTNTYAKPIQFVSFSTCTLTYTANANNSILNMNQEDYLNFIGKVYTLSIPHAIAAGGTKDQNGTAGTSSNTCNGGGGGGYDNLANRSYKGGTGCIFGQYAGGDENSNGYGYGSSASNKYRCALIIVVNGNLIINESCTITQNGGGVNGFTGGYGGGAGRGGGGGGAPVFIYYTGTYTNNGTINTAGGYGGYGYGGYGYGGAGGIKTTKISLQ